VHVAGCVQDAWQSFKDQFMDKSETAQDAKGLWDKAGEYWNDPSKMGSDIKGAYNSLPTGAEVWQGTKDIGAGIASGAADIYNDPGAAASAAGGWVKDQAVGVYDGTIAAYNKDGAVGVL
jgi:hypothetical protein